MGLLNFNSERTYREDKFSARTVFQTNNMKVIFCFFKPEQFIPVHSPSSDILIDIKKGSGIIKESNSTYSVDSGDIIVIKADKSRGIRADPENRLETLMVVSPPPTEAEHKKVREGIQKNQFIPKKEK